MSTNAPGKSNVADITVLAVFTFGLFALFSVFQRLAREELPTIMVMWSRFALGGALLLFWIRKKSLPIKDFFPRSSLQHHVKRSLFGVMGYLCLVYTAPMVPVSDVLALQFSIPLMLAVLARYILKEEIPTLRKIAIGFGAVGVLLVAQPHTASTNSTAIGIILIGCVFSAFSDIQIKLLTRQSPAEAIALFYFATSMIITSLFLPWYFEVPSIQALAYLLMMGIIGAVAQVLLGRVFQRLPASAIAPYAYSSFVWSLLADAMIWGHFPNQLGILGAICIMADGLLAYMSLRMDESRGALRQT